MTLRWLPYSQGDAAWNMAVDEAILEAHLQGRVPATLRFYGWQPSAVSIGYAQRLDERVLKNIRARGFKVVRRPTGGRAVLHHDDLTYSFVSSSQTSAPGASDEESISDARNYNLLSLPLSVSASYLQICAGLIEGLKLLNVPAEIGRGKGAYNRFQDCFQATTTADLQVNGLKIVGSAQLRRKQAVLQHGSILLDQSQTLMGELLKVDSEQPAQSLSGSPNVVPGINSRHCNLFEVTGKLSVEEVEKAFVDGFSSVAGQRLTAGTLTDFEIETASKIISEGRISLS